jgi:HEAT repeat protein
MPINELLEFSPKWLGLKLILGIEIDAFYGNKKLMLGALPENLKKDISRILLDFVKTIKIISVYPENNPLPLKLKETFNDRFLDLIRDTGGMVFSIGRGEIRYQGEAVYKDGDSDDSLAYIFFNSGITEISFDNQFGVESSNQFFKIMKAFLNREEGASDLVSLFWQANIAGFDYATLEDLVLREYSGGVMIQESMESDDSFIKRKSDDDDSGRIVYANIFLDDDKETFAPVSGAARATAHSVGALAFVSGNDNLIFTEAFAEKQMGLNPIPIRKSAGVADTALILNEAFAMGQADKEKVDEIFRDDMDFDGHASSVELLREIFRQENDYSDFNETVTTVEKMQSEFLKIGQINYAEEMLTLMKEVQIQVSGSRPKWGERVNNALVLAGSKEKLENLRMALNNDPQIVVDDVKSYLSLFGWEALSAITGLLGDLEHRHHREALCDHLSSAGHEHIDIIARGIYDRRWFVVRNTAAILSEIGSDKAFSYLEKAIGHEDPRVRLQIVKGLSSQKSNRGIGLLAKMIWDADGLVGQTALEALMEFNGEELLGAIIDIINDARFPSLSPSNQERIFIYYSSLGGEHAVAYLASFISGMGISRGQAQEFYQQIAFKALGHNRSEKAEKVILKYSRSWSKKIRRMAAEAISSRRQIIYGGR